MTAPQLRDGRRGDQIDGTLAVKLTVDEIGCGHTHQKRRNHIYG